MNAEFGPQPLERTRRCHGRASLAAPAALSERAKTTSGKLAVRPDVTDIGSGAMSRPGVHSIRPLNCVGDELQRRVTYFASLLDRHGKQRSGCVGGRQ